MVFAERVNISFSVTTGEPERAPEIISKLSIANTTLEKTRFQTTVSGGFETCFMRLYTVCARHAVFVYGGYIPCVPR